MIERRQIVALSFFPAFVPPDNGGVERLYNFYAELSRHHDVTLISSAFLNGERDVVRHRPAFTEIRVPKDAHFANAYEELRKVKGEGDISGPAIGKSSIHFGALHDEYLAHYAQADIIMHDSPFLIHCDIFRGFDSKLRIYNSYNCETDLYAKFHSSEAGTNIIADLVRDLEQELCRHCDLIAVCSDEDAAAFRGHFAPEARFVTLPNGFTPVVLSAAQHRAPRRLLFLGSAHKPNLDAVRVIIEEIAPKLPDVQFDLVGSCHSKSQTRNIVAHGIVSHEAKLELLRSATAAINPMLSGGGSSLKIADIASNRCPLLSTELGARGFGLSPQVHYIPLDADSVAAIRTALNDKALLDRIAAQSFEHFERHFGWPEIAKSFVDELQPLLARPALGPKARLVVNDYNSLGSVGGGATRTQGLCGGLSDTSPIIFLAFADGDPSRRVSEDGRILTLLVDKSPQHLADHDLHNSLHWVSTADIVSYRRAPENKRLMALFRCAASCSSVVICEHPYMVGLPRAFGVEFIYSSQNFEATLKAEAFRYHPLKDELLSLVREAEAFACAASNFIVAVSDADASDLSATYRSTAPILVVANGADGPILDPDETATETRPAERPIATFMGSMHGPNLEAARWIVNELAPRMPQVHFTIIGSIAGSLEEPVPANVTLIGEVSARDKSRHLQAASVALNPMMSGSGSNVKMADYLQHGLPVLTTEFGARGYEWLPDADAVVASLEQFEGELRQLLAADRDSDDSRRARRSTYASSLSMVEGGRRLARLIDEHSGKRKRALYVTYRYNDPARGGGEEYVVRLVHALAASGWEVDVVSPAAERIVDVSRFSAIFSGPEAQPVPVGHPRVRSIKFPLDLAPDVKTSLHRIWNYQADYEEHVAKLLRPPREACLAWGWADPEAGGRWGFRSAGLHLPEAGALRLRARTMAPLWLQIFSEDGRLVHAVQAGRDLDVGCDLPSGFISFRVSMTETASDDPRPLAFFVSDLAIGARDLLEDRVSDLWADANSASERMAALAAARVAVRDPQELELSPLRAGSNRMDEFVRATVGQYDLLITHNAVFKGTTAAIHAAAAAQTPSVLVPHLHYDDDFYHFRDVMAACGSASATLVSPMCVERMLTAEGYANLVYHSPGVDVSTTFSEADVAAFGNALPTGVGDFFLVLGRKSAAKGYADGIAALAQIPAGQSLSIVMIGPDDDGVRIDHPDVVYLGRQPDAVVRGALRECLGLINMSRSESFGMVLLEAGLAGKPVLANRNCAAFADIIEDGVNGYLVTREDLPARMLALQSDPSLRQRLGREARERATKFDWAKVEQEFVRICDALVNEK